MFEYRKFDACISSNIIFERKRFWYRYDIQKSVSKIVIEKVQVIQPTKKNTIAKKIFYAEKNSFNEVLIFIAFGVSVFRYEMKAATVFLFRIFYSYFLFL